MQSAVGESLASGSDTITANVTGSVTGTGEYVGGAIGRVNASINGNIIASVNSPITGHDYVGGLIGQYAGGTFNGTINNNTFNPISVSGTSNVGGIIGNFSNGTLNGGINNITYNSISVSGTNNNVGGIIGSFSNGTINGGISAIINSSSVTGTSGIGGAIGSMTGGTLNAGVTVELNSTSVKGRSAIGGAVGDFSGGSINGGSVTVAINNGTIIGDATNESRCINAGGAIGQMTSSAKVGNGKVAVTIEGSGVVNAGGTDGNTSTGVGGAIGVLGSSGGGVNPVFGNANENELISYISVYCESPDASVISASSPVGGAVGTMLSGSIYRSYSTVAVSGQDYVGGFIGNMVAGRVDHTYVGGHTIDGGHYSDDSLNVTGRTYVGGFIGYAGSGVATTDYIKMCYSTASVGGSSFVGGFIGRSDITANDVFNATYCTGLVCDLSGSNDSSIGAYAGYIAYADSFNTANYGNKVLRGINVVNEVERWGISGNSIPVAANRLNFAPYTETEFGPQYIRANNPNCIYNGHPFDSNLPNGSNSYPYRCYLCVQLTGDIYRGEHYGDWPIVGESSLEDITSASLTITMEDVVHGPYTNGSMSDITLPYRYGSAITIPGAFTITLSDGTVLNSENYEIFYDNNTYASDTAKVTAYGIRRQRYIGSVEVGFTITPIMFNDQEFTVDDAQREFTFALDNGDQMRVTINNLASDNQYVCNGNDTNSNRPGVTLTYINNGTPTNIPATDYTVTYTGNNIFSGDATITIAGNGTRWSNTSTVIVNYHIRSPLVTLHTNYDADTETTLPVQFNTALTAASEYSEPVREGYTLNDWYMDGDCTQVFTGVVKSDLTLYAGWTIIPATAPTIDPITHDEDGHTISVMAQTIEGQELTYQWYFNTSNTTEGGTAIDGATEETYDYSGTATEAGTYYYYCVVTATRTDNGESAYKASDVISVTVSGTDPTDTTDPTDPTDPTDSTDPTETTNTSETSAESTEPTESTAGSNVSQTDALPAETTPTEQEPEQSQEG
ncbi:MAG: InlB B-repeat-containing protein [Saccharofermentans sp.]|nr:InlB B-repeat-containing protein [Saccharofermentans sp.]